MEGAHKVINAPTASPSTTHARTHSPQRCEHVHLASTLVWTLSDGPSFPETVCESRVSQLRLADEYKCDNLHVRLPSWSAMCRAWSYNWFRLANYCKPLLRASEAQTPVHRRQKHPMISALYPRVQGPDLQPYLPRSRSLKIPILSTLATTSSTFRKA